MRDPIDRRRFIGIATAAGLSTGLAGVEASGGERADPAPRPTRPLLTEAGDFVDVSRGKPKPFTLRGEALARAQLTPETWRLEVVPDESAEVARPARLADGSALDLAALTELGRAHGVRY